MTSLSRAEARSKGRPFHPGTCRAAAGPARLLPAPLSFGSEIAPLPAFALRPFSRGPSLASGPHNHPHTARPLNQRASRPAVALNPGEAVGLSAGQNA